MMNMNLDHEKLKLAFPYETIKIDGVPYLTRYYISGKNDRKIGEGRSVFLHCFHTSDQGRELHNHPYVGHSYILKGSYTEERMYKFEDVDGGERFTEVTSTTYQAGDENYLPLSAYHRTDLPKDENGNYIECWTLFITGERVKNWGFLNRDTKQFFPYMDANEVRQGSGPHSRDDIDEAARVRRAREAMNEHVARGELQMGDEVMVSYDGQDVVGVVREADGEWVTVGTEDGGVALYMRRNIKPAPRPFTPDMSRADEYGCPDRTWLKEFAPEPTEAHEEMLSYGVQDIESGAVYRVSPSSEVFAGALVRAQTATVDGREAYVYNEAGEGDYVRLEHLRPSKATFKYAGDADEYGCPDRSWFQTGKEADEDSDDAQDDEDEDETVEAEFPSSNQLRVGAKIRVGLNLVSAAVGIGVVTAVSPNRVQYRLLKSEEGRADLADDFVWTVGTAAVTVLEFEPGDVVSVPNNNELEAAPGEYTVVRVGHDIRGYEGPGVVGRQEEYFHQTFRPYEATLVRLAGATAVEPSRFTVDDHVRYVRPHGYHTSYKGRTGRVAGTSEDGKRISVELSNGRYVRADASQFAIV